MNRRSFMKFGAAVGIGASLKGCELYSSDIGSSKNKPNIILILTDDQGWGDASIYGHPYLKTPNIDRLAKEGTRYTQFYVNSTVCAPSRVSLMTGQYPAKLNVHHIYSSDEFNREHGVPPYLDPDVRTISSLMKANGYATAHIGKWHLCGRGEAPTPEKYGFDSYKITHGRHTDPNYEQKMLETEHGVTASSHWIMEDGIKFIEANKDSGKPFYLNLWTRVPHSPLNPSQQELEVYAKLKAKPEDFDSWMKEYAQNAPNLTSQMKVYCASMTSLDEAIGKLLDYLDRESLSENTLIIFASDNGPEDYNSFDSENAGLGSTDVARARKRSLYEGGIKVPCIVKWSGKVPANKVSSTVWTGVDLLPSFAAIINAELDYTSQLDGEDVSDIWFGANRSRKNDIYWEWKYNVLGVQEYSPPELALREGNWKLLCNPDGSDVQLFDIKNDPQERRNLAVEKASVAAKLKKKLLAWKKNIPEKYIYPD